MVSNSTGGNLSYEWLDENDELVDSLAITQVSQSGIYTLLITDQNNGCTDSSTVSVTPDANIPTAIIELNEELNCTNSEVTLDGSSSTSVNDNSGFEWIDGVNNSISIEEQLIVSDPGVYTLIITDNENGCTHSTQVEVIQDIEAPNADAGIDGLLTCDNSEATLDGSNSTGGNLSYEWLDENDELVDSLAITQVSQSGIYTLLITDQNNGCTDSSTVSVTPDANIPTAIIELNEELNCTNSEVTLDGSSSTSVNDNSGFEWIDGVNNSVSIEEQLIVSDPGVYTLIITDNENGCTHLTQIEVIQNVEAPNADAGIDGLLTCDNSEATLDGSNSTGGNLSYEWLDENDELVDSLAITQVSQPGIYTLLITDQNNGCTDSSTVSVTPDANIPTAIIELNEELNCTNSEVTLDGSSSTSVNDNSGFEWIDGVNNSVSIEEQLIVSDPGVYTLIITDNENGCTHSTQVEVIQNVEAPNADAGIDGLLTCDNSEATLDGTNSTGGNLSYEWLDENDELVDSLAITQVSQSGIYTLLITDQNNGCTDSSTVSVTPDANIPTAIIELNEELNCTNSEVTLDGSSSTSVNDNSGFEWIDGLNNSISIEEQLIVSDPGVYTLIITDNENGCTHSTQVEVIQNVEAPNALIENTGPLSFDCNTSTIILDGNASSPFGNISFYWSTFDGNILSDENTPNPEIDQVGTYILTVTNLSNFCVSVDSIVISENFSMPLASIQEAQLLTCFVTEITLDASGSSTNGNFIYSWTSVPPGGIISGENTLEPIINQAGIYTLSILNNENGCSSESELIVSQDTEAPIAVANSNEQFDCITESVSLDGTGSSLGSNFTYQWTGSGVIENEFSLSATVYQPGLYNLLVANQENGCTASDNVNVNENTNEPSNIIYEALPPNCFGDQGSIEVFSVVGGQPPYLFSLDGGEIFSQITYFPFLAPGNYSIIVQDAIGCEYEQSIAIPFVNEIELDLESEVVLNLGDTYEINAQINFPVSEIDTIIWSPASGLSCTDCLNPNVDSILETTQYSVTVINNNGCQTNDEITLRLQKTREIFIPNVFTPHNEDGLNDLFMIFGNNDKINEINTFRIFDRWGELIYEANHFQANDPANGWDGFFKNERLNPGVFVYFAEIEFIDGVKIIYSGDVTLLD